ncbi:MAG: LacI family transcriptional regulator [Chloroflexi bacterium]|nr:MAG: LacI family transcriptional regulator [Chloroflexota bacterium]
MPRPTIADVARRAGVSKSTVSRVLSGNVEYMRPDTKARVEQAIAELGYRPSHLARSLTSKRTYTAALLVSDVGNPFYPEVIHGVEDVALSHGYDIYLCNTNYDVSRGLNSIRSLIDRQVDGILIMSSSMTDEWLEELVQHSIPTVVLDWVLTNPPPTVGIIGVDYRPGIQAAVEHLLALGHRRFAHVSGPLHLPTALARRDAFLHALAAHGINPSQVAIIEGNFRVDGGRAAMDELLSLPQMPTAVFTGNDMMAMGLVRASRARGLQVPRDISVVGLDDIWLVADMEPPLTTVALPRYEIGQMAMRMLLDLLKRPPASPYQQVETRLVCRQSTAAPPAA